MTGRLNATPAARGKTISISEAARIIATVISTHTEFTAEGEADLIDEAAMLQIAAAEGQRFTVTITPALHAGAIHAQALAEPEKAGEPRAAWPIPGP